MYERSAIVLERYFDNLLSYRRECNLRDNFNNYCGLVDKLEKYQINYQKELAALQEYNDSLNKIRNIQKAQKNLYKKSAKLEYNRNLLFNNLDGKVEDIRRCIEKIEEEVKDNNAQMNETKEQLLVALGEYNDKKFELSKCKRYKKMAENDYNELYDISRTNFIGITDEEIAEAKAFSKYDDEESIIESLVKNGKGEKIPFNEEVIGCVTKFGIEIAKKEAASYLVIYEKMNKLLTDIENGTAKINLHKKYARNEKAKIDFILAVKEYEFQFLDYERMTVIHGRKSHNRLMSEACENFNTDIIQIDNLYELLLKEISNKATKKAYKDLYNKSYLTDIKEKEERFKKEKNRVNLNTATLVNSNYWRIEGIRGIYTIFYKNVSEVFGRDVAEFDIPKEFETTSNSDDVSGMSGESADQDDDFETVERIPFQIDGIEYEIDHLENDEEDDDDESFDDDEFLNFERKRNSMYGKMKTKTTIDDDDDEEDEEDDDEDYNSSYKLSNYKDDDEEDEDDDYEDEDDEDDDDYDEDDEDDEDYDDDDEEDEDEEELTVKSRPVGKEIRFDSTADEDFDIFGEKYKEIDFSDSNVAAAAKSKVEEVDISQAKITRPNNNSNNNKVQTQDVFKEVEFDEEDLPYEIEDNEAQLFDDLKKTQRKNNNDIEDFDFVKEPPQKSGGMFDKFKKKSGTKKNHFDDVW